MNEKFTDKSDPIEDLGIGTKAIYDSLKDGDILQITRNINADHPKDSYVVLDRVRQNGSVKDEMHFNYYNYINKEALLADPDRKTKDYHTAGWIISYDFYKNNMRRVKPEELNEKFTEDSDAIADMNIGQNHFKEQIMKLIPLVYTTAGLDYIAYIRYTLFDDQTSIEYSKDSLGNTVYEITCTEYSYNEFFTTLETLISKHRNLDQHGHKVFTSRKKSNKGVPSNKMRILIEDVEKPLPTYEEFKQDFDPIEDMSIGAYQTRELYAIIGFKPNTDIIDTIESQAAEQYLAKLAITYKINKKYTTGIVGIIFYGSKPSLIDLLYKYYISNRGTADDYVIKRKI